VYGEDHIFHLILRQIDRRAPQEHEQTEEYRHLYNHRKTSARGIEIFLLIQRHHLFVHLFTVMGVFFLDFLHSRLYVHHFYLMFYLVCVQREQAKTHYNRENYERYAVIPDDRVNTREEISERFRKETEECVQIISPLFQRIVASRVEGVAFENPSDSEIASLEEAIFFKSLNEIG
jgi:hypothetical protein